MRVPPWAQSLKARLTALFFFGLIILLVLGGGFILDEQERSLVDNIDTNLTTRADDLVALLEIDTRPGNLGINRDEDTIALILDIDGTVLVTTDRFGDPAEIVARGPAAGATGRTAALPSFLETIGVDRMRVVHATGPRGEAIYVAQSLQRIDQSLSDLRRNLVTVGLTMAIVAGVLCWFVVRQALRPVGAIANRADDISLAHLDQRLPVPGRRDEIGNLTLTLNGMLERLETSAEQQQRLIADIAHELRSPLTAVATQLEVGLTHPTSVDWETTAAEALDETNRLQVLINDLLLLAQLDHGHEPSRSDLVDLDEVVLETVARVSHPAGLSIDASGVSAGLVRGERKHLERAVQNLLDNAVRHANGQVVVRLREDAGEVILDVIDDGDGVPIEERDRIFERFYRTQEARDRLTGGTGLGLALARETVEAHGGNLTVSDGADGGAVSGAEDGPEGGAAFTMTLPLADT